MIYAIILYYFIQILRSENGHELDINYIVLKVNNRWQKVFIDFFTTKYI